MLQQSIHILCGTCGRGQMVFGDIEGNLHFLSRQLELNSFRAYEIRVAKVYQLKQHNILITIGVRIVYVIVN